MGPDKYGDLPRSENVVNAAELFNNKKKEADLERAARKLEKAGLAGKVFTEQEFEELKQEGAEERAKKHWGIDIDGEEEPK